VEYKLSRIPLGFIAEVDRYGLTIIPLVVITDVGRLRKTSKSTPRLTPQTNSAGRQ